ncbi:MAG: NAD(P)-binding domain-containing protein [Acidimicrobiia bacterium]
MKHHTIVIGAGPIGLAAASHLVASGIDVLVLESGPDPAHNIRDWSHVRLFTDWASMIDTTSQGLLEATGWTAPPTLEYPSGGELIERYLEPLAELHRDRIRYEHRVVAVSRENKDKVVSADRSDSPFLLRVETKDGVQEFLSAFVIDASGTWTTPNPMGADGLPTIGEEASTRIRYGIPDVLGRERDRYRGRRVLVVGAGHSAANALLDLTELALTESGTQPLWAIRRPDPTKAYGAMEGDELPARGKVGIELRQRVEDGRIELESDFLIRSLDESSGTVRVVGSASDGSTSVVEVDEVVVATGQRPALDMTRELRLDLDPWLEAPAKLAPLIDPNVHSCLTVPPHGIEQLSHPEPGFFTIGIKSYGRAPTFLMATGYKQVSSVVESIAS